MTKSYRHPLSKLISSASHRHDLWRVFSDFVEMAALSIANRVDLRQYEPREARYMQLINAYEHDERKLFPDMLGALVEALEEKRTDVLGEVFMELELGNKWAGQFFTPQCICDLMAAFTLVGAAEQLERQEFITIHEPACGGGAMLIGVVNHLHEQGIDYQNRIHVSAIDLDLKAVHMAYIQLSLLGVPAVVIHGNSLTLEERSHWYTPAHLLGFWDSKLRRHARAEVEAAPSPAPIAAEPVQASLFEVAA